MPGDGLALTVLVRGEQQRVGVLQSGLQFLDGLLLGFVDHVVGLEGVIDVHGELGPGLLAVLGRQVGCPGGQIPHVADGGQDGVAIAQVARDLLRLRR